MAVQAREDAQYKRMTESNVVTLILRLSIPTTISMLVTSAYNMADTAFVGQLGTSASGAVGVVFGYMSVIQAIGFMFGQGAGSIVSRALGRRDQNTANSVVSTGFFLSLGVGLFLSAISLLLLDPLVRIMGSTPTIAPYAKTYISFILVAAPFMMASFLMNQVLRYEGKAALGMIGMMCGCTLNIIGDMVFMFGLNMGIAGAGLSTAIAEIVSFSILLTMYITGRSTSRLSIHAVRFERSTILDMCTTGFPSLLRQGLTSYTTMLLNVLAAPYGDAAVAAMSIVGRITFFVFSLALGVGQGFQPVCAFNYGAERFDRVRSGFKATMAICEGLMVVLVAVLLVFSGDLIKVFRDDPEVIAIGTRALVIQGLSLLFISISMVTEMLYQSSGKGLGATLLSALRGGVIFIPAIFLLSWLRGLEGIEEAQSVAYLLAVPPAIWFARRFFKQLPK